MHSLSVVKAFMLAAAVVNALPASQLETRQAGSRTLVPGIAFTGANPPVRKEIRNLTPTELNIYYLALELMQALPSTDMKSFYRVGGIHGTNYRWDGDNGGAWGTSNGYCRHGDRAFPTWHRPYLSLYEKTLHDLARDAISRWPAGADKTEHETALASWRIPYWDWASNAALAPSMGLTDANERVNVRKLDRATGRVTQQSIHNPLYSYIFPTVNDAAARIQDSSNPNARTRESVRNPTVTNGFFTNRPGYTNSEMVEAGPALKTAVFDMFSSVTNYNQMSNTQEGRRSLEQVHGSVHVITGGWRQEGEMQGHMFYPAMAGFDPIFYLHHTNVDRLLALWQAMNPNSYMPATDNTRVNGNTPLHPFRRTDSEYWTSMTARDVKAFGYTYPELLRPDVRGQVATLYGATAPAQVIAEASRLNRKMKRSEFITKRQQSGDNDKLHTPPNVEDLAEVADKVVNTTTPAGEPQTYNEYTCLIKSPSDIADGSYRVLIFFGEPTGPSTEWTKDDKFVGSFDVFAPANGGMKMTVQGSVALTNAFLNLAAAKKIADLKPETVKAFLQENLKWKLNDGQSNDAIKVTVETAKVTVPEGPNKLPVWGTISTLYEANK